MSNTNVNKFLYLLLMAFVVVFAPFLVNAQDVTPTPVISDDQVNAIASGMYCPVCESIPLDVCPTLACQQWREEIRIQLAEGATPEDVVSNFVARYGDRVVGTPQNPTLRALSLVTPWVIALGVAILGAYVLSQWRKGKRKVVVAPSVAIPTQEMDDLRARLEADLRARR